MPGSTEARRRHASHLIPKIYWVGAGSGEGILPDHSVRQVQINMRTRFRRWKHCAVRPREFIAVGVACGIADGRQEHVDEGGDAGRHSLVAFASATASASEFGANPRPTGPPGRAKRAK